VSTNFIAALDAEIRDLESELEADPRYQKLRELKRVQDMYSGQGSASVTQRPAPQRAAPRRAGSPERKAILEKAKEFISGRNIPTTTAEIFDHVSRFVEVPGEKPKNNLSAMLSNSDDFVSHGRAGWTLAEPQAPETPEAPSDLLPRSALGASILPASLAGNPDVRPVDPVPGGGT